MEQASMTALVSAFSRAYHYENNAVRIYSDPLAKPLLSTADYDRIAASMTQGRAFFLPGFTGSDAEALRLIVDRQLSPSPLGRAAFAERALEQAVRHGAAQYLPLAAGYDTLPYRLPAWARRLQVFELDHPATAADKRARLLAAGIPVPGCVHPVCADLSQADWPAVLTAHPAFDGRRISFCSALGLLYYLDRPAVGGLLSALGALLAAGSAIAFDYPDRDSGTARAGERAARQTRLAAGAQERMHAGYAPEEMEFLLADCGFRTAQHLLPEDITREYFAAYNEANPAHEMRAFDNVNYCLAVKR